MYYFHLLHVIFCRIYTISVCLAGTWGFQCAHECQCQNGGECDPVSGQCQCTRGFHGDLCNTRELLDSIEFFQFKI